MSTSPNDKAIGRYELLTRLAVGGMAEIFLALEHGLGGLERTVVIKRILPHLAENAHFVEMFLREARIIARLSHPNVVQIHELGETAEGTPFIAMEYIGGSTARELQILAEKGGYEVPVGVSAGIVTQAARGLHAAHELTDREGRALGIVHRDISPHNLIVTAEGHVKLLDFGIAKATQGDDATFSGALKGKFSYLSPEQVEKKTLDRRSDIFALGIVFWELLTGRRLFKRPSELEMIEAVRHDDVPPPSRFNRDVPRWLDRVAMMALARDRDERYGTADDMRRALERAADESLADFSPDAIARFVQRVAADTLAERAATLLRAREDTLVSSERRRLLPELSGSAPSVETDGHTAVERKGSSPSLTLTPGPPTPWRRARLWVGLTVVLAAAVVGLALQSDDATESPNAEDSVRPTVSGDPLPMGWPPTVDADRVLAEIEPFQDYLEATLGRPIPFVVTASYADCAERLGSGELAFGVLPPLLYVTTTEALPELRLLAIKEYDGSASYSGWLMVRDDIGATSLADLRGRTFCFTEESSTSGYFLPLQLLRERGYDPEVFIGDIHWSGQHLQALRDVLDGRCEVVATYNGAVYSANEAGLEVGRLQLVETTGRIPQDAIVAAPWVDDETSELLRQALIAFDPEAHTGLSRVGAVQRITGFVPADDSLYLPLRRALEGGRAEPQGSSAFPD